VGRGTALLVRDLSARRGGFRTEDLQILGAIIKISVAQAIWRVRLSTPGKDTCYANGGRYKVKFTLEQILKAQRESESIAVLFP
jgi:hypothetical protein